MDPKLPGIYQFSITSILHADLQKLAWRYPKSEDWGAENGDLHATSDVHKQNIVM
jgi:hypothetical protein